MGPTQQQLKQQQHPSYFIVWPGLRTTAQTGSLETSRALERTCLKKGLGDGDGETWINLTDNSGARMNRMYWLVTCEKWGENVNQKLPWGSPRKGLPWRFRWQRIRLQCRRRGFNPWVFNPPEDPLEKGMASHSSSLVWRTPWTEKPGGLWTIGSQRVEHDWVANISLGKWTNSGAIHWP